MCERYNGWSNYETWNVKLWLDDESAAYDDVRALTREANECDDHSDAVYMLSNALDTYVCEALPELLDIDLALPMMFGDLLAASLRSVDWYEIAESYLADMREED